MEIARSVAKRSPCSRRKFGAILVKEDAILATGYNGSARGVINCGTKVECLKDAHREPSHVSYKYCPAVHAETNAVLNAARSGVSTLGATLYLAPAEDNAGDRPCHICRRMCINAGIKDCYYVDKEGRMTHEESGWWVSLENEWIKAIFLVKTIE